MAYVTANHLHSPNPQPIDVFQDFQEVIQTLNPRDRAWVLVNVA